MAETALAAAGGKPCSPAKDVVKDSKIDTLTGSPKHKGTKPKDMAKTRRLAVARFRVHLNFQKGPRVRRKMVRTVLVHQNSRRPRY